MSHEKDPDAPLGPRFGRGQPHTTFEEKGTRPHKSAQTEPILDLNPPPDPRLREHSAPVKLVRQPTEMLAPPSPVVGGPLYGPDGGGDAVTRRVPSAPVPTSGAFTAADDPFDRLSHAAAQLRTASENLDVDGKHLLAQMLSGVAAGLASAPTTGSLEYFGAQVTMRLLLAQAGVGGKFTEDHLGKLLIETGTAIIAGVDPARRAARQIAKDNEEAARRYRVLAEKARARNDLNSEAQWLTRADERDSHARELRKAAR